MVGKIGVGVRGCVPSTRITIPWTSFFQRFFMESQLSSPHLQLIQKGHDIQPRIMSWQRRKIHLCKFCAEKMVNVRRDSVRADQVRAQNQSIFEHQLVIEYHHLLHRASSVSLARETRLLHHDPLYGAKLTGCSYMYSIQCVIGRNEEVCAPRA